MSDRPKKTSSGEHPEVRAFRAKLESIAENTMPLVQSLNDRTDALLEKERKRASDEPPADDAAPDTQPSPPSEVGLRGCPQWDSDKQRCKLGYDPRREDASPIPDDVVEVAKDPFPTPRKS